jgi:hypothetical protein
MSIKVYDLKETFYQTTTVQMNSLAPIPIGTSFTTSDGKIQGVVNTTGLTITRLYNTFNAGMITIYDRIFVKYIIDLTKYLTIPITYNGTTYNLPITVLGNGVDKIFYQFSVPKIFFTFSPTITTISAYAFNQATKNLLELTLPDSLISIGYGAFVATPLNSIIIPKNVSSIGPYAFSGSQLMNITFKGAVLPTIQTNSFNIAASPLSNAYFMPSACPGTNGSRWNGFIINCGISPITTPVPTTYIISSNSIPSPTLSLGLLTPLYDLSNINVNNLTSNDIIKLSFTINNLTHNQTQIYIGSHDTAFDASSKIRPLHSLLLYYSANNTAGFGFVRSSYNNTTLIAKQINGNTTKLQEDKIYDVSIVFSDFGTASGTLSLDATYNNTSAATKFCYINYTLTDKTTGFIYTIPQTYIWFNDLKLDKIGFYMGTDMITSNNVNIKNIKIEQSSIIPPISQPATLPISLPISQPATLPISLPESQPATLPISLPISQPAILPESQPISLPISQPATLPISLPESQPAILPISLPESQPAILPESQPISLPESQPATLPISNLIIKQTNTNIVIIQIADNLVNSIEQITSNIKKIIDPNNLYNIKNSYSASINTLSIVVDNKSSAEQFINSYNIEHFAPSYLIIKITYNNNIQISDKDSFTRVLNVSIGQLTMDIPTINNLSFFDKNKTVIIIFIVLLFLIIIGVIVFIFRKKIFSTKSNKHEASGEGNKESK